MHVHWSTQDACTMLCTCGVKLHSHRRQESCAKHTSRCACSAAVVLMQLRKRGTRSSWRSGSSGGRRCGSSGRRRARPGPPPVPTLLTRSVRLPTRLTTGR